MWRVVVLEPPALVDGERGILPKPGVGGGTTTQVEAGATAGDHHTGVPANGTKANAWIDMHPASVAAGRQRTICDCLNLVRTLVFL
jgi:hypothetical protein